MSDSRRYSIEIKEIANGKVVAFATAHWTAQQRRVAVAQTMRLAGLPKGSFSDSERQPEAGDSDGRCRN